jgi:hypothetical protein
LPETPDKNGKSYLRKPQRIITAFPQDSLSEKCRHAAGTCLHVSLSAPNAKILLACTGVLRAACVTAGHTGARFARAQRAAPFCGWQGVPAFYKQCQDCLIVRQDFAGASRIASRLHVSAACR